MKDRDHDSCEMGNTQGDPTITPDYCLESFQAMIGGEPR